MTTRVWRDVTRDAVYLVQYSEYDGQRRVHLANGDTQAFGRNEAIPRELMIDIREPQALLDALLAEGYRPTSSEWSVGQVRALERHVAFAEKVATTLLEKA